MIETSKLISRCLSSSCLRLPISTAVGLQYDVSLQSDITSKLLVMRRIGLPFAFCLVLCLDALVPDA